MSRGAGLLVIICLWAALYLPFLGSVEIRGEEGKRVMPAIQMLATGNYLVPYLGASPYLNKPPLINWLVAGSFRISGTRNEWTARFPSALFVLLVAMVLVTAGRPSLGAVGSFIASACWLMTLELIAKGRTIETDAINASIFALALIWWLIFWNSNRSAWITFTIPWIFLGLGCLTKGPGLLVFFYCIVLAVAWRTTRLRELVHPAHWIGLGVMFIVFCAWALPFFLKVDTNSLGQTWSDELSGLLFGEKGRAENWELNFPRGIAFFIPGILLLPLIHFRKIDDLLQRETARGLWWGGIVPFVVVLLFPGSGPRYVLPLAAPLSWLIGLALANNAFELRLGNSQLSRALLIWTIAIFIVFETAVVSIRATAEARKHHVLKPAAAQINAVTAGSEPIYAIGVGYEPYLFYVHSPVFYLHSLDALPDEAHFFLIQSKNLSELQKSARWTSLQPQLLVRTDLFRSNDTMLFSVTAKQSTP